MTSIQTGNLSGMELSDTFHVTIVIKTALTAIQASRWNMPKRGVWNSSGDVSLGQAAFAAWMFDRRCAWVVSASLRASWRSSLFVESIDCRPLSCSHFDVFSIRHRCKRRVPSLALRVSMSWKPKCQHHSLHSMIPARWSLVYPRRRTAGFCQHRIRYFIAFLQISSIRHADRDV